MTNYSAPLLTLDAETLPTWLVKMASFTGLGFITFGNVSAFAWFYISKSVLGMLMLEFGGALAPKQAKGQMGGGLPDIMNLLQPPKLD